MNSEDLKQFPDLYKAVLRSYHKEHAANQSAKKLEELAVVDLTELHFPPNFSCLMVCRSLKNHLIFGGMNSEQRLGLENEMCKVIRALISQNENGGKYYSRTLGHDDYINDEEFKKLLQELCTKYKDSIFEQMSVDSKLNSTVEAKD